MKIITFYFVNFIFFILVASATLTSVSAMAAEQVRNYPLTKIAPHTYVIHGPLDYPSVENQGFMNNPGFVITKNGVVVIDPGSSLQAGRMFLKQMRRVTKLPVTHVFNTHVHGDHWLANQAIIEAFPKAELIGHPEMITMHMRIKYMANRKLGHAAHLFKEHASRLQAGAGIDHYYTFLSNDKTGVIHEALIVNRWVI